MWLLFSMLCMILLMGADIIGKKAIVADELAALKLRILTMIIAVITGLLIYAFGLGESGLAPWTLALKYPLILVSICFLVFSEFLYMFSLKQIGMSIMEAISGFEGIGIFLGMIVLNLISGKLPAVKEMLIPSRLFIICIILIFTILLPNVEKTDDKNSVVPVNRNKEKRTFLIGILIALSAVILSSSDSLINDAVLGTGSVGAVDYIMTGYFLSIVPLPIFCIVLNKKSKHKKSSNKIINRHSVLYAVFRMAQAFFGLYAIALDAVRSEIIYLTYPVIAIIGAKIFLKEKYTWKQNLCIWVITISAIAFCVIDYVV